MGFSDLVGEFFYDVNIGFMIKFILIFIVFVLLPVWKFNFVELSLGLRLMFTVGGGVGAWFALQGKSLKGFSRR